MSDFNIRGITTSARRPSVGAYAEVRYRPAGKLELYTGLFAAKVELPNRADAMIVYYAVARSSLGSLFLDIGGWYIDYPGGTLFNGVGSAATCTNGAFFFGQCNVSKAVASYLEAYAKPTLTINDALAISGTAYYSPSWGNTGASGTYAALSAKVTVPVRCCRETSLLTPRRNWDAIGSEPPTLSTACRLFQLE
jgi:hypothetical protein